MAKKLPPPVHPGEILREGEVIRDGLRPLVARDKAVDAWLHDQVVPAAQALQADPSRGLTVGEVREQLTRERAARRGCPRVNEISGQSSG
jgi:hypothetical protein